MSDSTLYDSRIDTLNHIAEVRRMLIGVSVEMLSRGEEHDASKLESPEVEYFDKYTPKLKGTTYGSPEYERYRQLMQEGLDHHYAHNSHHPEHHDEGMADMNMFDLLEMLVDWIAATRRHADGDIYKSLEINQKRFGYSDEMRGLFGRTIEHLMKNQVRLLG